ITKQRDGPDKTRWSFTIELVPLGDGRQSYVVVPADTPPASKPNRWTRGLSVFRDAASNALLDHGQDHRVAGNGPLVKACPVTHARAEHNRLYVHNGEGDRSAAERQAWSRALKTARNDHLIGGENRNGEDLIWMIF